MDIFVPRSFCENQCVITRPHGGQPIPWTQPIRNCVTNIMIIDEIPAEVPRNIVTSADSTRPSGRNTRALLRSDTPPIRNFESP